MYQCILRDSCSEIIKKKQRMCLYHIYKQHCSPIPLDHCSFLTARTKNCAALRVLTRRLEPKATKINYKKPIFLRKKRVSERVSLIFQLSHLTVILFFPLFDFPFVFLYFSILFTILHSISIVPIDFHFSFHFNFSNRFPFFHFISSIF